MSATHSLAEWASVLSLGIAVHAAFSVPYFLLVDAARGDFDPRPLLARAVRSEAVYPLLREWDTARYASREALRDVAALLLLLTTSPKGQLR
ncbi:hypothetical protein [Streptomyces scabiei]|uniref:hypothetical protein n=1 Tax=Streptomyces scabiei TaxID=1930 RepID=UPI001B307F00|nr:MULTISPECIES: hypothetical protein [Streptomyces]MBP5870915.1 hypothetical protein [Streptomyces sp. LBUM 1485]MDX2532348.1 hypothetical protein [Streptomyces scabiei]MDX2794652.1 hypothetical protein [Streptomyces scabiei]MDX3822346.1 hypothetical protein [Streptomyces scabiei]QTU57399.1 hypothetical protein F3K21_35250 [Streptomyces sp. LBUM 1480]